MRAVGIAVIVAVLLLLATIQLASDAVFSSASAPGSIPSRLPPILGARVYGALARSAPLPSFEAMLATYDLETGNADAAQSAVAKLAGSPMRYELTARIDLLRGDDRTALDNFLAAPDIAAVQSQANRIAQTDPKAAYRLDLRLLDRLVSMTTHPDAVAETDWRLGELGKYARIAPVVSMRQFVVAAGLAPYNVKYQLAAARQAQRLGDPLRAAAYYRRALQADPANRKAAAGLATVRVFGP